MFFRPFSIAITSLGEERANISAFSTFVRFVLAWFCLFPLPLGVREGLRFVIVVLPGLFSYHFVLMWRLCCPYLFIISPSLDDSGGLCFVMGIFPRYLLLYFCVGRSCQKGRFLTLRLKY